MDSLVLESMKEAIVCFLLATIAGGYNCFYSFVCKCGN